MNSYRYFAKAWCLLSVRCQAMSGNLYDESVLDVVFKHLTRKGIRIECSVLLQTNINNFQMWWTLELSSYLTSLGKAIQGRGNSLNKYRGVRQLIMA